jgi:hypothetical protein
MFIYMFRLPKVGFYFPLLGLEARMLVFFSILHIFLWDLPIFWPFRFSVSPRLFDRLSLRYQTISCLDQLWRPQLVFRAFFIYRAFSVCTFGAF